MSDVLYITQDIDGGISNFRLQDCRIPFLVSIKFSKEMLLDSLVFHQNHSLKSTKIAGNNKSQGRVSLELSPDIYRYRFSQQSNLSFFSTIGVTQDVAFDKSGWWCVRKVTWPSFTLVNLLNQVISLRTSCPWLKEEMTLREQEQKTISVDPSKLTRGLNRGLLYLFGQGFKHRILIDIHGILPETGIHFTRPETDVGNIDIGSTVNFEIEMTMEGTGKSNGALFCPQIGLIKPIEIENHGPSDTKTETFSIPINTSFIRADQRELVFYFISNSARQDQRFQIHRSLFQNRHLILNPSILVYDKEKGCLIPDMVHVDSSDGKQIDFQTNLDNVTSLYFRAEKLSNNSFRIIPNTNTFEIVDKGKRRIFSILIEGTNKQLNRELKIIVNK